MVFYFIFNLIGLQLVGIGIAVFLGFIGFCIGTFKIPDTNKFNFTEATGGEAIDDVIKRWIKFKRGNKKIYVYLKEETKDEW